MNLRTSLPASTYDFGISHDDHIFCMGSCFVENIGQRLIAKKFSTELNPFGILYNPISIAKSLHFLLEDYPLPEKYLVENQGIWHSFYHHSRFSRTNKSAMLAAVTESRNRASQALQRANRLLLTLGTAFVFEHRTLQEVVANCHKLPATQFIRRRLAVAEIVEKLVPVLKQLKSEKPALEVLLTVSPVRHLRDGFVENQRSKATLILAVDALCEQLDFVQYFPAYELLLDDLRDYRFFDKDMVHPSAVAVDYVWNHFAESFFDAKTKQLNAQIDKIQQAIQHRPFQPESEAHQAFLHKQLEKLAALQQQAPQLDFSTERQALMRFTRNS